MKRLFIILGVIVVLGLTSCARDWQSLKRDTQTGSREYWVEVYSGGKLIKDYHFKGILNNQTNSDGYYFYQGDSLVEVGGDIIVKSVDL